ncbi:MAG: hypothetical protein AAGA56_27605, partial [Myxococcota bacterium]
MVAVLLAPRTGATETPRWSSAELRAAVRGGQPVVVHVTVALCHNEQVNCGAHGLGSPGNLRTNLYWGAMYGTKTIFAAHPEWRAVAQHHAVPGILERAVYRRRVPGTHWNRTRSVEQLVVIDAIHGTRINRAVERFYRLATSGGSVTIDDGNKRRRLDINAVGYAGHNRLMDGMRLPTAVADPRQPVPSFVMACLSDRFFSQAMRAAGSTPIVMTRSFMAPEGYVVEAAVRALGDHRSRPEIRSAVVDAYA